MKKVAKKGWCITAAVMAVSVIVCIFCFVRWERKSSDLSFQFEETTYTYEDEYYEEETSALDAANSFANDTKNNTKKSVTKPTAKKSSKTKEKL